MAGAGLGGAPRCSGTRSGGGEPAGVAARLASIPGTGRIRRDINSLGRKTQGRKHLVNIKSRLMVEGTLRHFGCSSDFQCLMVYRQMRGSGYGDLDGGSHLSGPHLDSHDQGHFQRPRARGET